MFLPFALYVSANPHGLSTILERSLPTGVLIMLGSLLFIVGTVWRHNLPNPDETAESQQPGTPADPILVDGYVDAIAGHTHVAAAPRIVNPVVTRPSIAFAALAPQPAAELATLKSSMTARSNA